MRELTSTLRAWSAGLRGDNRERAVELMLALAVVIEEADRGNHFGSIESHGVTFAVQEGQLARYQTRIVRTH